MKATKSRVVEVETGYRHGRHESGVVAIPERRRERVSTFGEHDVHAWSHCSQRYDAFAEEVTSPYARDAARLVNLGVGMRCLDVAAGTGAFSLVAAETGADVLATDFSPLMIEQLQRKCARRGIQRVSTAVMDGQNLNLDDGSFDVAASVFGLIFFPDHHRGLTELHRVLKPGGRAVVVAWGVPHRVEIMNLMGEALLAADIELPQAAEEAPPWTRLGNPNYLKKLMADSGFCHVHIVSVTHLWTFTRAQYLAELLSAVTPTASRLFRSLSREQRAAFLARLGQDFETRQGGGPYGVTSEALIAVGTKAESGRGCA